MLLATKPEQPRHKKKNVKSNATKLALIKKTQIFKRKLR